jgi:hypothetical protein
MINRRLRIHVLPQSKPSSTSKQNKHGIIFFHRASHKVTSSQNAVLFSLFSLFLSRIEFVAQKFSHTVFVNCCPHLHDTSPGISLLGIYHISYDEKMVEWQWSVKVALHTEVIIQLKLVESHVKIVC